MIQRIQTIFLLAAFGLLVSLFFVPMASDGSTYTSSTVLFVLLLVTTAISFVSIFLYRNRMVQIRLSVFNSVVLLGFQGLLAYYFFTAAAGIVFSPTLVFPLVAAILTFLAMRYIARDEAMVRAADRLRK